ncbi:MAG: transglutaminase-like domain-containing protein, partial [Candidatus Bathyarchaeota archaeon]|nr:transglutaminase-like domain-containing protein [Candidatus Bathyarchaeota archaeon]
TRQEMDVDGNTEALMEIPTVIPPGESVGFTVTYIIDAEDRDMPDVNPTDAEGFDSIPPELVQKYVVASETFMMDDPDVASTAAELAGDTDTVLETLVTLLEHVTSSTEYCNFEVPQYPNVTLNQGQGDCDDQSILLISMLRSLGVPAYLRVGIVISPSIQDSEPVWDGHLTNIQDGVGWHGWAMIYVPPWGWLPVDLTLVSSDDGLELINQAPEYNSNIVASFDVNKQGYIGETMSTRERITSSDLYVTITDEAEQVFSSGLGTGSYIVIGLGVAVMAALVLMFISSRREA